MPTARRFLITILVPALIVSIFAVGAAAAQGSGGKADVCHWAGHKFVQISVSVNARPAHLGHGDVDPDEYGDCSGGGHEGDEEGDGKGDHDGNQQGNDGDSRDCQGARSKSSHNRDGSGSSDGGSDGGQRSNGHGDKD